MIFERGFFDNYKISKSIIMESLKERTIPDDITASYKPTVFLSHKHDDLKDLRGVMGMLQELGAKIYIDSMDKQMPNETSGETAHRLKTVIKTCNKFILLATDKAIESYWCNWELGFGDTHKYIDHIAILPMKEKDTSNYSYKGNEYLQIYPRIDYENGLNQYESGKIIPEGYYVSTLNGNSRTITLLKDWINKGQYTY